MDALRRWLEITFVLIIVYLILSNGTAFSTAITSIGGMYIGSVKALQGR
jgi:hypothetical protein